MKIVILLVVAFALASVEAFRFNKIIDREWADFKIKYGKRYASPDVELVRKLIFADRLYEIGSHNEKYVKGLATWTEGINEFTDLVGIEVTPPQENQDAVLIYLHVIAHAR